MTNQIYKIYNYRTFEDYQYGHGTLIGTENSKRKAIQIAKYNTYGGREWCSVTDGKDYREVFIRSIPKCISYRIEVHLTPCILWKDYT